jgi:peptide/nickel transport system permease protein
MRVNDALQTIPALVLAMAIAATLGPGLFNVMVAVGIIFAPRFARLVRGQVLAVREEAFVESARAVGASHARIILRELLPNVMNQIIVIASLEIAIVILIEAALSFLGLGVKPPEPSWGLMIAEGRNFMFFKPHLIAIPGFMIFLLVIAINMAGDGLRDVTAPEGRN